MKRFILLLIFLFSIQYSFSQERKLPIVLQKSDSTQYLIFHITGDGGYKGFDFKLTNEFHAHQMSYIVLNSFKYFWSEKDPDKLASGLIPILKEYLKRWDKSELILSGLSFGAEVIPFLYTRLPEDLKSKVRQIVLITPAGTSDFTIHLTDMIGIHRKYEYDVVKEVEKINEPKILALFGDKENSSFPANHKQNNFKIAFVKGGHHFTDAKLVMKKINEELK